MKSVSRYFKDPANFRHAVTHRSYCNEHPGVESNERLEFLGDAILSLIISDRLYRLLPHHPEGDLTGRRSWLVQTTSLSAKSLALHLDDQLLLSRGEEESGGRQNSGLLADTFEAVLGALFIDSGIVACYQFISDVFPDSQLTTDDIAHKDAKSMLQELSQASGWGTPVYTTIDSTGPDHAKNFNVEVSLGENRLESGNGASKQKAQNAAARSALEKYFPGGKIPDTTHA